MLEEKKLELLPELFEPAQNNFEGTEDIKRPSLTYWQDAWQRLRKNKLAIAGLGIIILLVLMALIGPYLNHYTYFEQDFNKKNMEPNSEHWFGTDSFGRDIFTRAWYGARISILIGILAALIDFAIGVVYGGVSALKGGQVDNIMMRIAEILYSLPYLLVVILLMVILPRGLFPVILAISITGWLRMARIVRGQVLQLKEMEFVHAAEAMGASTGWILKKHMIPNIMGPILVNMTLSVPSAIFAEATLSFLGLGVQAPMASWGSMANDALTAFVIGDTYQLFIPAFLISLIMFAFNVLGDGLRDALDPRLRK